MLKGYDVSSYQGNFTWPADTQFAMVKATESTGYQNPDFASDWNEAWHRRLLRGAYHFADPAVGPTAQAEYFVDFVRAHGINPGDALILDHETGSGVSPEACSAWASEFTASVRELTGKNLIVYSYPSFISGGYCAGLGNQPLWIASYTGEGTPEGFAPWATWTIQQFADAPEDQDIFNGDATIWGEIVNAQPEWVDKEWTTGGELSLIQFANAAGFKASTFLKIQVTKYGAFNAALSDYIGRGDLNAKMPKGIALWTRVPG